MPLKTLVLKNNDAFVASTDLIDASVGRSVRELKLGIKAQQTAAAIIPDNVVADIMQPIEVRLDGSPIISIRGSDLIAMDQLAFGDTPYVFRSAAVINNRTRIHRILLPLNQPPRERGQLVYKFNFVAGANCSVTTLTATEILTDEAPVGGYYHMVEIPHTLPAALGYGLKTSLAMPGDLLGLLIWNTTVMAAAADTQSVQEIKLFVDGTEQIMRTAWELYKDGAIARDNPVGTAVTTASYLDNYVYLDLKDNPIPKASKVEWQINAGVVGNPVRLIPLYQIGGAGA